MRRFVPVAVVLVLLAAHAAQGSSTAAIVRVTISRASCAVAPRVVSPGAVVFRIANRSGRGATFRIGNRRASITRGRSRRLTVTLRANAAYECRAGRRVGRGVVRVVAPPQPPEPHRIGVRGVGGVGEFFDRTTNAKFVPRGHEYVRFGPQVDLQGATFVYHTTFNVGRYDAARSYAALARMAAGGYNVVTVGLNAQCAVGCAVDTSTGTLSAQYFANVVDFIRRAKGHGLQVMLGTQFFVDESRYARLLNAEPRDNVDNINLILLTEGGIAAYAAFWTDVVRELRREGAPFDAIFAYELFDEIAFAIDAKPFTLSSGSFRAPNGTSYDLSRADDRRRLQDDSIVHWLDRVRAAIRGVDETALVTLAFFEPHSPNPTRPGDIRILETRGAIERSTADFIDIHPYPGINLTLDQYMQNFGISGNGAKPIVIGEYGAFKFAYGSPAAAVPALVDWQRASCRYGIDGWILWTWDSEPEQPELWSAVSGTGEIERALAPAVRPDPCG